jgi:filamentous hemagglutinin
MGVCEKIVDLYNRQLHPEEKTLARQLAEKSGGKYMQTQVEEQLRIMGVSTHGDHESGAPDTLIGQAPTDSGAQWISAGTTANDKPILTQITAQANPELQAYILAKYNSASPGDVPSQFSYDRPTGTGSWNISGPFTKFDQSDTNFVRNTTADGASMVSTTAGRFSAAAGAAAEIPSPYAPGLAAAAFAATVVGYGASAVEQLVRPNPIGFGVDSTVDLLLYRPMDRYPLWGPAINEAGNSIKNSDWLNQLKEQGNSRR